MDWYISNFSLPENTNQNSNMVFSSNIILKSNQLDKPFFFWQGYFVPRLSATVKKSVNPHQLLQDLYAQHGLEFIHYIKGAFTIILFVEKQFHIFTDRHNQKKYFIFRDENYIIISNNIKTIAEKVQLRISNENVALFSLINRFPAGYTLFQNLSSSLPASVLSLNTNGQLSQKPYWKPEELFRSQPNRKKVKDLAQTWKDIIGGYTMYLKPKQCCITLTGGNDSRMVLAGLLSNSIKPVSITYGSPKSVDGVIAEKIAKHVNLEHHNHFVEHPTVQWFTDYSSKIIENGNTLLNIHRAHRLDAIEKQKETHPEIEMLFTGLVGGEYIKEPINNNITIPDLIWFFACCGNKDQKIKELISRIDSAGFEYSRINLESVYNSLQSLASICDGSTVKQKKFILTYHYYAVAHHTQDPEIFSKQIPWVVNPFMDIDFLEMLASSKHWYVNKKESFLNKFWHSYFLIKITDVLFEPLSEVPFAKKGSYSGKDMLRRPLLYLLKRVRHFLPFKSKNHPQNFPMGSWLYDFCKLQLGNLHPDVKSIYKPGFLENTLEHVKTYTTEEHWRVITNAINTSLNLHHYEKS